MTDSDMFRIICKECGCPMEFHGEENSFRIENNILTKICMHCHRPIYINTDELLKIALVPDFSLKF